jgi:hypothetical protein
VLFPQGTNSFRLVSFFFTGKRKGGKNMIAEVAGFTGAGISGAAYAPQVAHMVRAHCSGGVSETAYVVWLLASALLMVQAAAIRAVVFVALGSLQIAATITIIVLTARYKNSTCTIHERGK